MKKSSILAAVAAAGAAAVGAAYLLRNRQPAETQPVTTAEALLTLELQARLSERIGAIAPDNGFAMILSDDRG